MKKYLLILLSLVAVFASSCKEDKYSVYNYGLDHWTSSSSLSSDAITKVYETVASEFIASGLVIRGYQISGDDITANDAQAAFYFDQNLTRIKNTTIPALEKQLQGTVGAPFTVSVDYLVLRGSTTSQSVIKSAPLIIKVEPKPVQ